MPDFFAVSATAAAVKVFALGFGDELASLVLVALLAVAAIAMAAGLATLRELVRRRQAGEPVAYLTGRKEFWSLDLLVDRRVLVPRPDTETAVEVALHHINTQPPALPVMTNCRVGT